MIKDGGPAFPVPSEVIPLGDHMSYVQHAHGMSLRDYFAAAALPAMAARYFAMTIQQRTQFYGLHASDTVIASEAYDIADAMLRARASGEG